jgi:Fe(3+) dicitrate transport protein
MQLFRIVCTLAIIMASTVAIHAQNSLEEQGVTGRVVDGNSGEPLVGATVVVTRASNVVKGAITNSRGQFQIIVPDAGDYELRVRYIGYGAFSMPLRIDASKLTTVMAEVAPDAVTAHPVEIIGQSSTVHRTLTGTATRVSARQIESINPLGTQELLSHVPGVHGFADDGIGNSRINIGMRGLNPRRSSRVLVLEDGIPIEPAVYIYPNMYYNPPSERIEALEVIKGSGAIKYGPQTMGGVINYVTERPTSQFSGSTRITGGNNGYASIYSEIGGWGSESLQPQLQLLFKRGDGFRQNNSFQQYNGTLKLNIVPDESKVIYVKANVNYENSNATYTGLTEYSFRTQPEFNPKKDDNFAVFRSSIDAIYTDRILDNLISTSKAYFSYLDRDWWRENDVFVKASDYDGTTINPVPYFETGDLIRVGNRKDNRGILRTFYTLGVEHSYDWNHSLFGTTAGLDIGARLHFERFLDRSKEGSAPDARDGILFTINPIDTSISIVGINQHFETTALALYALERIELGALTVTPGVRFEVFEQEKVDRLQGSIYQDRTSMVVLPGIGFNYQINDLNLFAGIHRGYTPPSDGTLTVVGFGQGGLDLESEKSWNSEIGMRGASSFGTFELAAFHVAIEDMVAAARATAFQNLGSVVTYGIEFAGTAKGSSLWEYLPDLNVQYTWLQATVVDAVMKSAVLAGDIPVDISGKRLPYTPEHTVTAGLAMDTEFGLGWRFDVNYMSKVYTDFENIEETYNRGDTGPISGHATIDAGASYRLGRNWGISCSVKNLTDEIYIGSRLHSSPRQPEAHLSSGIIPGPRRQINLSLSYQFGS